VKDVDYVPFVLLGNKCDLVEYREVQKSEGEALAKRLGCLFMETSAKERINVDQAFQELVRSIKRHKATASPAASGAEDHPKNKKGCVVL
jgi:GTPase KRas